MGDIEFEKVAMPKQTKVLYVYGQSGVGKTYYLYALLRLLKEAKQLSIKDIQDIKDHLFNIPYGFPNPKPQIASIRERKAFHVPGKSEIQVPLAYNSTDEEILKSIIKIYTKKLGYCPFSKIIDSVYVLDSPMFKYADLKELRDLKTKVLEKQKYVIILSTRPYMAFLQTWGNEHAMELSRRITTVYELIDNPKDYLAEILQFLDLNIHVNDVIPYIPQPENVKKNVKKHVTFNPLHEVFDF